MLAAVEQGFRFSYHLPVNLPVPESYLNNIRNCIVSLAGTKGDRSIAIPDFYLLPGDTPERETVLDPGDIVTHVTMPALPPGTRSYYLKLHDRASYEFALASAAVVVKQHGGRIDFVRVAMGAVGAVPWRSLEAERALQGKVATPANFRAAADAALDGARPQSQNGFKVELAKRCLTHALAQVPRKA